MTTAIAKESLRRALEDDESGELLESLAHLAGSPAIFDVLDEPMADPVGARCDLFTRPNSRVGQLFTSDFVPVFVRGCYQPREHMTLQCWACGMPFALTRRDYERRARDTGRGATMASIRCTPDCAGDGSWRAASARKPRARKAAR